MNAYAEAMRQRIDFVDDALSRAADGCSGHSIDVNWPYVIGQLKRANDQIMILLAHAHREEELWDKVRMVALADKEKLADPPDPELIDLAD